MSDKFKPPRKHLPKRSLLPEPSGDSSTDDEANNGESKSPFKALLIRARPHGTTYNEEEKVEREVPVRGPFIRPSVSTSSEELEVTPNKKK